MKRIHFIGICGVAMSALAIAFKKKGWHVTGSDAGFYPPVSTNLEKNAIQFYPGWHPEKLSQGGDPDLVVVGNVANSTNPEWLYVKKQNLKYLSYPEAIAEFFVKPNSIVCAGTYGKTTSSALLSWILQSAKMDPSYMFGGIPINNFDAAALTDGEYSVLEGDEYKTAPWDMRPKFSLYSPTYLLLTSISWDHADIYKTDKEYISVFKNLVAGVPKNGLIVGCFEGKNVPKVLSRCQAKMIIYGRNTETDYCCKDVQQNHKGIQFDIAHHKKTYHVKSPLLGDFNAENITGCFAMAHQIGLDLKVILKGIATFKGLKRRLEKRLSGEITVIDDIAHSPAKVQSVLTTLKKVYKGKIILVFEPNTGNRKKATCPQYKNAFRLADQVIIPHLSKLKHDLHDMDTPMDGEELKEIISASHRHVVYIEEDTELVLNIIKNTTKGDTVVFCGSHGFRGMIEEVAERLK